MTQINRTLRRAAAVALAVAGLLAAASASATTVLNTRYGGDENWIAAGINAMGGTGVALDRGGFGAVFNPATLAWAGEWRVDAGLALAEEHEDRFQPLFDSFGSFVTDTAIASKRSHRFGTGFAASRRLNDDLGLGLALTTRYGYGYDFSEDVRDPDSFSDPRDRILEERAVEIDGDLHDLALGLGWWILDDVRLGAALHYVFGTPTSVMRDRFFQDESSSYVQTSEWKADGVSGTFGVSWSVNERLELGASYDLGFDVSGDRTTTLAAGDPVAETASVVHQSVSYPKRARAGFALHPRSEPRTVFSGELVWTEWSTLTDSSDPSMLKLEDTLDWRVGVEHTFYNGVPLRFGFRHLEHYADPEPTSSLFGAGIGMPWQGGLVDVGCELGKVVSDQTHWFAYPAGFAVEPVSRVEETLFRLGATFTYRF
ncbi:MAG TPA: hypothetical protein P5571_13505 [Candidatus Krumholzibacteria bacterium]|nr:hypothetical protein [Candidatus Krumholzibacteria bacterium]HRX52380.1 hypothetical protein [Candidatus Krumholzibacteria bacterium]